MWYEAYAFTQWLSEHAVEEGWVPSGTRILLPNDPEFEKAARGGIEIPSTPRISVLKGVKWEDGLHLEKNATPSREYPWGDEITANHCSYNQTEIGTTSTPGCFPLGMSPYGLHDMGGNVDEWIRSKSESSYEDGSHKEWHSWEDPAGTDDRVLRDGSFDRDGSSARCAYRGNYYPNLHSPDIGFRLVALPPSE